MRPDPFENPEPLIQRAYAYCAYQLGPGADAEDVTSETFERALRYRDSYDRSKGSPATWLIGIARRQLQDLGFVPHLAGQFEEPVSVEEEERTLLRVTIAGALASLAPRDRELIALRFGGDLTAAQIGSLVGLRQNTVEAALHRALERLRRALGEEGLRDLAS